MLLLKKIHFICLFIILAARLSSTFVLLTANIDDVTKIVQKLISNKFADEISDFLRIFSKGNTAILSKENDDKMEQNSNSNEGSPFRPKTKLTKKAIRELFTEQQSTLDAEDYDLKKNTPEMAKDFKLHKRKQKHFYPRPLRTEKRQEIGFHDVEKYLAHISPSDHANDVSAKNVKFPKAAESVKHETFSIVLDGEANAQKPSFTDLDTEIISKKVVENSLKSVKKRISRFSTVPRRDETKQDNVNVNNKNLKSNYYNLISTKAPFSDTSEETTTKINHEQQKTYESDEKEHDTNKIVTDTENTEPAEVNRDEFDSYDNAVYKRANTASNTGGKELIATSGSVTLLKIQGKTDSTTTDLPWWEATWKGQGK